MNQKLTVTQVSDELSGLVLEGRMAGRRWWIAFAVSAFFTLLFFLSIGVLFWEGIGVWGVNIPVAWGFAIVNFVWWIGIGHAGTFISAILLLCNQRWRTSINRFAEAMTLFAVMCAGSFPLLHLGRPQRVYWLLPYPNTMLLWPQFKSPLIWDEFAVATYFTVSLIFWYIGLIPDVAILRDRATKRVQQVVYGIMALGWRGSSTQWRRFIVAYYILAGFATPLVVSVHSIVSMDFAAAGLPGWHNPFFPPYFVAGAIFSGFAMVLTIAIPMRRYLALDRYITTEHLDNMGKVLLLTGMIVAYGYSLEVFQAFYSNDPFERFSTLNRALGPYAWVTYTVLLCNVVLPQSLWWPSLRRSAAWLFILSLFINLGMWLERFMIVVVSLHRDFLPSSWGMFYPTIWDLSILAGSLGFFTFCFLLFARYLPVISIHEMKEVAADG